MPTLQIWNRCNNKCIMCTNPLWFQKNENSYRYSFSRFVSSLKTIKRTESVEGLHITGGEPTLHPDFFEILNFLRREFPETFIYLLTNGRMLYYENFAKQILDYGKIVLQIPVLGHNGRLHDRITGIKGSFKQTVGGIRNILKNKREGQKLEIRVVLVRQNYRYLEKIVGFIHKNFKIDILVLIFPEPEGRCAVDFNNIGITYSEAKNVIFKVVRKWKDGFRDLRIYHFPLCTVDHSLWPFCWITQDPKETTYIRGCRSCRFKDYCPRIHKDYLKLAGRREFVAPDKAIKIELNSGFGKKYHPIMEII